MIKKLTTALVGLGLACATFAGVQVTSLNGTTAIIAAQSTNSYGSTVLIPVGHASSLTIGITHACTTASTVTNQFVFSRTADGINWFPWLTMATTNNGTALVYFEATLNVTNVYEVRLDTGSNTNTTAILTNLYVVGFTKQPR